MESEQETKSCSNRRLRFRLRTLLLSISVVSVALGMYASKLNAQRTAERIVLQANGRVTYDFQPDAVERSRQMMRTAEAAAQGVAAPKFVEPLPPGPRWLRRIIGDDAFASIVEVKLPIPDAPQAAISSLSACNRLEHLTLTGPWGSKDLRGISELKQLKRLSLSYARNVDDEALAEIEQLKRLEILHLTGTAVTDRGMPHLAKLKRLKILSLNYALVTDQGLIHLADLKQLQTLDLRQTNVSVRGVDRLRRLLPDCKFDLDESFHLPSRLPLSTAVLKH